MVALLLLFLATSIINVPKFCYLIFLFFVITLQLIVNASFSQTNGCRKINNQSYLAFLNKDTEMCALEPVPNSDSYYYPYGNMFISEGKRGPVLKVWAKGRTHVHFIAALQSALYYEYSYKNLNHVVGK